MAKIDDREYCYKLLFDCFDKQAFSNLALNGSSASDFVRAAFYGTITYLEAIDFMVKLASGKSVSTMDTPTATIIRFGAWQILFSEKVPDYAAVSSSVELSKKYAKSSKGFINHVLRSVADLPLEDRDITKYKPEVATSLKSEIFGIFKKNYGRDRAISIGRSFLEVPSLSIRVNVLKTDKESLRNSLIKDGFKVTDSNFIEDALIVTSVGDIALDKCDAFVKGEFFVQSESAMLASIVTNPQKGDKILDCCSAPGGKSTHMAELTNDEAKITSLDVNASRLELIKENVERLGISSINCQVADSTKLAQTFDTNDKYDIVACDVPCSGLGLLARKPDIRLTISYERIQELLPKQQNILCEASSFVKEGGVLIYSTCTVNRAENEEQVRTFLESHPDFRAEDITNYLPKKLIMDEERTETAKKGMITLLPDTDGSDGFFIARLRRE